VPKVEPLHSWDMDAAQARALQVELANRVDTTRPIAPYETIAGADVSFDRGGEWLFATIVVLRAGTFEEIERSGVVVAARFPYISGLLSFREAPALIEAYQALKTTPDLLVCDGQGIAHPRRLGIASHLGLWLGIPTVGCAKSRLFGHYEEPGPDPGDWSPLLDRRETIGAVLRTRAKVKPLLVSPGHLCDLPGSIGVVMSSIRKYRQPVTTRLAHQFVNELRVQSKGETPGPLFESRDSDTNFDLGGHPRGRT
jgi:deoxyribonuclease V